ncbi:hypothetical protein I551_6215 [Mycobacterium ulcerans str. Harvey]|uniref:Uncharacterized protein n=1 Tax=Mycobacterium ulcerans str. Harvey TaxID=1299332 RepID=A0ABP3A9D2_MYCUL|nr:hypothetical protein I551_6215 [Mycobacterium ulcerans str. Harvey]
MPPGDGSGQQNKLEGDLDTGQSVGAPGKEPDFGVDPAMGPVR